MFKTLVSLATSAVLAVSLVASAQATEGDGKKVTDMLFETPHISAIPAGTELLYKFERKPSDEKLLGAGFTDNIKLKIESDAPEGKKNVVVNIYSGDRAREPNRITDMNGNPMLVVYLDTALGHFQQLAGGDRAYLKNKFSKSFANAPKLEPVKISYKGADVDGFRISVSPYADDPSRAKMRGYEGSVFTVVVSDKVPGHFVQMTSNYTNAQKEAPNLVEKTTLDGVGGVK